MFIVIDTDASHYPFAFNLENKLRKLGYRAVINWYKTDQGWRWVFDIRKQVRPVELSHGVLIGDFA